MANVKTINGLLRANCKSRNGVLSANIKTINGVDAVVSGGSPFGGLVSTTDLVEWWPLSEASGTRVGVHAGLDLADNNTVTGGTGGPDGSDYSQFTRANNEYLSRASEAALQTGDIDFTFCAWVYLDSKPASSFCSFVSKFEATSPANQAEFGFDYQTSVDRFRLTVNQTGQLAGPYGTAQANTLGSPSLSTWYFLVAWHDATANTVNIQANDGTVDSVAWSNGVFAGTAAFEVGRLGPSLSRLHDGRLQRVGYWKRLLTSGERTALYASGNGLDY